MFRNICKAGFALTIGLLVAAPALCADLTAFDGLYVGRPVDTGTCKDVQRDFTVKIANGQASMIYDMRGGLQMVGDVTGAGKVHMKLDTGTILVDFDGTVMGDVLMADSKTLNGRDCTFHYSLVRKVE